MKKLGEALYELWEPGMNVPALIFANQQVLKQLKKDRTLEQIKNVATLPHVVKHVALMPDAHEGYGFPIGGVAAFDAREGIVSPGGVGYDINCGVRLMLTPLTIHDIKPLLPKIVDKVFKTIPSGVGRESEQRLSVDEIDEVAQRGVKWALDNGLAIKQDLERIEEGGCMCSADPSYVSTTAKKRGRAQLGTLGAGNHFLEFQVVEEVHKEVFGLKEGQVVVMIHTGSRGFGHQICADYVRKILNKRQQHLPDPELAYAYINEEEGQNYLKAMASAVNFAFTNRQVIMHKTRRVLASFFDRDMEEFPLLYDVAHNIAKFEEHVIDGERRKLLVHRKGATRAFPPGREELSEVYRTVGQPVLIPGSMGTHSYVLVGKESGNLAFYSSCHGAGRVMSRKKALQTYKANTLLKTLKDVGVLVKAASKRVVVEEAPQAYKNVDEVVESVVRNGLSDIVAKLRPVAVVKG